jgi:hypothetical protein
MRVIPFAPPRMSDADARALAEIEAALDGDGTGTEADYWRELRADVRSLSEPVDPVFADALRQRVGAPRRPARSRRGVAATVGHRRAVALAFASSLAAVLVAVFAFGLTSSPSSNAPRPDEAAPAAGPARIVEERGPRPRVKGAPDVEAPHSHAEEKAPEVVAGGSAASGAAGVEEPAGEAGGRLQHLGAAISLGGGDEGVQRVAGRVGRATVANGGFVESSRVQTQQGSAGEAFLTVVLPSAKLQATLSQLERIAPVRAETQSLQDITAEYHAAVSRLAAARAERSALLRALARATTAAAIESLHARLAGAALQISAAEHQQASVSHQASQAQVEVTVLGEAHHAGGGTLGRGLRDAGKVLTVSLAVLVVAAAVLVPLTLLLVAFALGGRFWRRQRRERVLGSG